jgi:NADH:ubiquinone oxidoreductase subunit 6 (subunit J)
MMDFPLTLLLWWVFASLAVGGGFGMVTRRNPVASLLFLVLTFFSLAAIYVLLGAHFIAAIQIIVYAGAIMVLFLFVIMLLNLGHDYQADLRGGLWIVVGFVAAGVIGWLRVAQLCGPGCDHRAERRAADRGVGGAAQRGRRHRLSAVPGLPRALRAGRHPAPGGDHRRRAAGEAEGLNGTVGHGSDDAVAHAVGDPLLHRRGRRGDAPQRDHPVPLHRADAERGEPRVRRVLALAGIDGQIFVFFVMTVAAAEAAVGLALVIAIFRHLETVDMKNFNLLRW